MCSGASSLLSDNNSDAGDSDTEAAMQASHQLGALDDGGVATNGRSGNQITIIEYDGDEADREQQQLDEDPEYLLGLHWPGRHASRLRKVQVR